VTEFVARAEDLAAVLFDGRRKGAGGAMERQEALVAAGSLIRTMARAGLRHRDIHAGNILLEWRGSAPSPHLLDLDRCEVRKPDRSVAPTPMLRRLQRSLRKWESRTGLRLSEREWASLTRAAAPG
jgi:hypothetical protein